MVSINFSLSLCNKDTIEYLNLQVSDISNQHTHFICAPFKLYLDMPAILSTLSNSMQSCHHQQPLLASASEQLLRAQALIPGSQHLYFNSLGSRDALYNIFNHPVLRCLIHSMIKNDIYICAFEDSDYCYAGCTTIGRQQIASYQI